jgi:hypothetical protein
MEDRRNWGEIGSGRRAICPTYVWTILGVYVATGSLNDKNLRAEHCDQLRLAMAHMADRSAERFHLNGTESC